ncbi:hypothetical protein ACFLS1_03340 [Verrucomicrobiota bacterium]
MKTHVKISLIISVAVICISLLSQSVIAADNKQKLRPGKTFYVEFPELGLPTHDHPVMRMGVYIPTDYTPDKPFPLFVWFLGSAGGDWPGHAQRIVDGKGFICVGLPYQKRLRDGNTFKGHWKSPWSHYKTMLDKLKTVVPNIDPDNHIAGGFSNGGKTIMWLLGNSNGEFQKYFYGFMPGGAGWPMGGLDTIKGRPMLVYTGSKEIRYDALFSIFNQAKKAGVDAEFYVLKGLGHVDPPKEFCPRMREWMYKKIVRRNLKKQSDKENP